MANSFWDEEDAPQSGSSFWDEEDAPVKSAEAAKAPSQEPVTYEQPGLGRRLYEQNVVIPVRAARHLAPFPETLQEYVIDPIAGAISGETSEERKQKREEYDRYLRQVYPTATEAYESRGQMAGGLYKAPLPIIGSGEGITEQVATRPESVGFNVETALNLLPPFLSAPRAFSGAVGFMKSRPDQRQSLKSYSKNPRYYDEYEARTGGKPVRALEEEVQSNLAARESAMSKNITDLTGEVSELKTQDAMQVARAIDDIKTKTELGTYDGDAMISARNKLQEEYKKTAEIRNKVLEKTQGEMNIEPLLRLVDNAENSVLLPEHKAAIRAVSADIEAMSQFRGQGDNTFQSISPRQLNELRAKLQNNVSWGGHSQPWEVQYKDLARKFNKILDTSIPDNEPLRAKIQEETLRYNTAEDLFGGDYPLRKFESAAKDPMKRRALENLAIPEIHDILKTIDYRNNFQKNLKFGEKPQSQVIEEYLRKKAMLEQAKSEKLPLSSMQAPSALESAMMETYRNPKLNATNKIEQYAQTVHPEGPMDFRQKMEATKILRDVEGINVTNGSRMVNLGRNVGAAFGGGVGAVTGNPLWATVGGGAGAVIGGALDTNASNIFRGGMRYGEKIAPAMSIAKAGAGVTSYIEKNKQYGGIPMDRLAGTKYEQQIMQTLQEDPKKAAVIHYVMTQKDPEYARLVSGGNE
jgi:hypothetical protein